RTGLSSSPGITIDATPDAQGRPVVFAIDVTGRLLQHTFGASSVDVLPGVRTPFYGRLAVTQNGAGRPVGYASDTSGLSPYLWQREVGAGTDWQLITDTVRSGAVFVGPSL